MKKKTVTTNMVSEESGMDLDVKSEMGSDVTGSMQQMDHAEAGDTENIDAMDSTWAACYNRHDCQS